MTSLSTRALEAARQFLDAHARPLEKRRYDHAFRGASSVAVLDTLGEYQNTDGGFGHALEPDLRAPESSALCTSIAFQIFRSLNTPRDHPVVSKDVEFFLRTFDEEQQGWRIIPESAEDSLRAPWWYQAEAKERF